MAFFDKIFHKPRENVIYVDETGFNRHLCNRYKYSSVGVDCILPVKGSQGNCIAFIGAISIRCLVAYSIFEGATDTKKFKDFLLSTLFPRLDSTVQTTSVLDNLSSHHSAVRNQQLPANVEFVFLPPYSPEFNPIEN